MNDSLQHLLVSPGHHLDPFEVLLRTLIVYVAAVAIVRIGKKRFMGQNTAIDLIMGIMLGSVLSRAVNGSAHLGQTLAAALALVAAHWVFSWLSFRSHRLGKLVKGNEQQLVQDGQVLEDQMRLSHITEHDLKAAMRQELHCEDLSNVAVATIERSGQISFIEKPRQPRVLEVQVQAGVQTIRLEIS